MSPRLLTMTAVSCLMISAALAQSPTPPASSPPAASSQTTSSTSPTKSANIVQSQKPDQWLASKFKGTDVIGADDQKVGDVSDILFDKNGKILAYVVSVGGFLGVGAKEVALAPE